MTHAFVDIGDKTMCSRCGNVVLRVDEVCPAISDGEIYSKVAAKRPNHIDAAIIRLQSALGYLHDAQANGKRALYINRARAQITQAEQEIQWEVDRLYYEAGGTD
jgi:hypothetical protein